MLVQEVVIDNDMTEPPNQVHNFTPYQKISRSDVHFPLTTPRKRAPSISSIVELVEHDRQSIGSLTIRARGSPIPGIDDEYVQMQDTEMLDSDCIESSNLSLDDLPLEVQGKILDYIFGDMHSIHATSTSLRGKSVSSLMRHPRRKAVSDFALVSKTWRDLVQERIYRHIKIKGTRAGLGESEDYFYNHSHLTKHIRHIEFWVPVWGDKASFDARSLGDWMALSGRYDNQQLARQASESLMTASDLLGFKLSVYSATLSEIFAHIACFFPEARVFTLEGGHCKKSNMIRQFPDVLFRNPNQALEKLPNIRTFAMRGAWNIMRDYSHWKTIETALPNVEEWHCGYAKPRVEADATINQILSKLPPTLRHVDVSLDGMYSKDPTTLGSSALPGQPHLCKRLGSVLPQLESLSFTGKICECLWSSAIKTIRSSKEEPLLKALEIVVKSCCRQRVSSIDPETGETIIEELGGVMADGAGITNPIFISAFERLISNTIDALPYFPHLEHIRIRFIDLDSPCTLLNPFWQMEKTRVYGIWSEELVEKLSQVRPGTIYEELGDGIDSIGQFPKTKPRSIKSSSYKVFAEARRSS